jgi:hypothetical protein
MQKGSFRLRLCPFLRNVLLPVENNQILAHVQITINGGIMNALVDTQSKRTRGPAIFSSSQPFRINGCIYGARVTIQYEVTRAHRAR